MSKHRLEDNIKINLQGVGWWGMDCIDLVFSTWQWIYG